MKQKKTVTVNEEELLELYYYIIRGDHSMPAESFMMALIFELDLLSKPNKHGYVRIND